MLIRSVEEVVRAHRQREGGGFIVRRPFPTQGLDQVDPFLLLDEMGPADYGPGEAIGAPDHPHRGFETVTYMLEGEFEHEDSAGHRGVIRAGDVQWMTAGAGIVHSEMPTEKIRRDGGRLHGFQLWVNLPARLKMSRPRYQEVPSARIPSAKTEDGRARVRVIAGEALGVKAAIDTNTPIVYQDWTLDEGADVTLPSERITRRSSTSSRARRASATATAWRSRTASSVGSAPATRCGCAAHVGAAAGGCSSSRARRCASPSRVTDPS